MRLRIRSIPTRFAVAATALSMLFVPAMTTAADAKPTTPGKPITVMTRNIYLGADIQRPVTAAVTAQLSGASPTEVVFALAKATHVTREIVDDTNFPVRSELLAAEIADTKPDLVGLQEVALWRSGPLQLNQVGVPNADTVDYDFLGTLLADLADEGVEYEAVNIAARADVEAPSFEAFPGDGTDRDVRLTMRDVILMRVDDGLRVTDSGGATFTHNLVVEILGQPLNFTRGYNWVDVRAGSKQFRFVNTHLEAFSSDLAFAQAAQVLAEPANHAGTTILACDCNSDPLNSDIKGPPVNDTLPHKAPYELITGPGGFTDQWLEFMPAEEGWTAGLSERVDDATPDRIDHRIDLILVRTADGSDLVVDRGEVTGDELTDRDPATGLWPSDHAGVVLRLRGPVG